MGGLTTFTPCRRDPDTGLGRLLRDRPAPAWLRHDAIPLPAPQSVTVSNRRWPRDVISFMDALKIPKRHARRIRLGRAHGETSSAALWPERSNALVSVSGYLIGNQEAGKVPLPPEAELQWWYQYLLRDGARPRGLSRNTRRDFAKLIWKLASPKWNFDDASFERSAAAFDNPDHVSIVIQNYRWRLGLAAG